LQDDKINVYIDIKVVLIFCYHFCSYCNEKWWQ